MAYNEDGTLTLSKETAEKLKALMNWRGHISYRSGYSGGHLFRALAESLERNEKIDFEVFT